MLHPLSGQAEYRLALESHLAFAGDADVLHDEIEQFVTGVRPAIEPDRVRRGSALATLPSRVSDLLVYDRRNSRPRLPLLQSHFRFVPAGAHRPQGR